MKKYEIMVIITNSLNEKEAQAQVKTSVTDRIAALGGKMTFEDFWGARGFAYLIKGEKFGYYYVGQFEIEGDQTLELTKELNIDTKVVRFLITTVDPKSPAPQKYADMKVANAAMEKDKEAETAPIVVEKPAEKPKDKVDKKLDAIVGNAAANL